MILSVLVITSVLATSGIGTVGAQSSGECVVAGESIQAAIDAASPGETICIEDGTFEEALLIETDNLALVASDGSNPVLNGSNEGLAYGIHIVGAEGVTIDGLTVRSFGRIGIYLEDAHGATIRNTAVRNNNGGVFNRNGNSVTIETNTLTNNTQGEVPSAFSDIHGGIHLYNASNNVIKNNGASGNYKTNVYVHISDGAIVRGNRVSDAPSGLHGSIYIDESTNAQIEANTVTDNVGGDLRHGIGLEQAHEADILDNDIERNQGVALHIDSSDDVSASGNTITNNQVYGLFVTGTATNTILEKNTIELNDQHGIRIQSDGVVVRNNVLSGNGGTGVSVSDGQAIIVRSNQITDSGANGVAVFGSSSTAARDGLVENNTISGSGGDGIWISGPRDVIVRDNNVTASDEHGIHAIDAESVVIDENNASRNQLSGIKTDGAINVTVSRNTVDTNTEAGILLRDSVSDADAREMSINSNTATNNIDGVRLEGGNQEAVNIEGNRLEENTNGVTIADNPASETAVRIQLNAIQNNANRGVNHQGDSQLINITNNWWGDASGPSGGAVDLETGAIANGTGDSIEHDRFDNRFWFDPWLTTDPAADSDDSTDDDQGSTPDIEIVDATTGGVDELTIGEDVTVSATVQNNESTDESFSIELEINGTVVDQQEITAAANSQTQATFSPYTFEETGTYVVSVNGITAGTVTVSETTEQWLIAEPGVYTLGSDRNVDTSEPYVVITADDVILEGNGHTLKNTAGDGTGISASDVKNVSIQNLTMSGWQYGLSFSNVDASAVTDVVIEENTHGLRFSSVDSTEVTNLVSRNNDNAGVSLTSSQHNTFTNTTATGNFDSGSILYGGGAVQIQFGSTNNTFIGLNASSNKVGLGASSSGNTFVDVTASGNQYWGLTIGSSQGNTFENISASGNSRVGGWGGIRLKETTGNEFMNVTANRNDGYGILLIGSGTGSPATTNNVFNGVTANNNDGNGVQLSVSNVNQFSNVTLQNNSNTALNFASRSNDNTFENVTIDGDSGSVSLGPDSENNDLSMITLGETTVSISGENVHIDAVDESVLPPSELVPLGSYVEINPAAPDPFVSSLRIHYNESEITDIDESRFEIWWLNGTWQPPENESYTSGVNTTAQYVYAENISNASTYGVFAPEPDAEIAVTNATLSADTILKNDSVTISADVQNVGEAVGTFTVALTIGGEAVDSTTVDLDVGETDSVEFTHTFEDAGEFNVEIADESAGTVTVIESAEVLVYGADIDRPEQVEPGDTITVTGRLYNTAPVATDETVELEVNGTAVNKTTTSVNGSSIQRVELSWTPQESDMNGNDSAAFEVTLNGFVVETVTVEYRITDIEVIAASVLENELVAGENASVTGSIYQAGNVEGPQTIYLNATKDGETSIIGSQDVTLTPGYYHLGAINITTEFTDPGTYDLTLGDRAAGTVEVAPASSDIEVISASVSADDVMEGEELYVSASIYQNGTIDGPQTIELNATNTETDETTTLGSHEGTLAPGYYHLGAVNLTFALEDAGTYEITLGDRTAGTVTVSAAVSDIEVIAASISTDDVMEGEELYVSASIYQNGTIDGPQTIGLNATNTETGETTVVDSHEGTLAPGFYHLGAVNISFALEDAGTYDLVLGDRDAGTVEVSRASSDIEVISASISTDDVIEGEELYVSGSLYQNGTIDGPQSIELNATNTKTGETTTLENHEATLAPGYYHLGAVNISFALEDAGTYEIMLGDRSAGTVDVAVAESDIEVISASLSAMDVTRNEELYVTGSLYQNGTVDGPQTINVTATKSGDSEVIGNQSVTLQPDFYHLGGLNVSFALNEPGTYTIDVGGREAGSVYVEGSPSDIRVISASVSEIEVLETEEPYVVASIYQAGETGTEEIDLTATKNGTTETTVVGSQEVTLESGFYHLGAVNISFALDEPGTYDLELGGEPAGTIDVIEAKSEIEVIAASVSADELIADDDMYVAGSLYQNGTIDGPQEIELTATNADTGETTVVGSHEATLAPGFYHLGAVNISFALTEPGTYDLTLGDRDAGTVEVVPASSDLEVISASVSADDVMEGEELYVSGSLYQNGTIDGPQTIELTATKEGDEPQIVGEQTMTLTPGYYHLGAVNISFALDEPGTYEIALDDRNAGTVEVSAAESHIDVISASASTNQIIQTEELYVVGSLYQNGTIEGPEEITLTATEIETGETTVVGSHEATLTPGYYHLGAVNISFALTEPGTYDLTLGERDAGIVEVVAPTVDPTITAVNGHSTATKPDTGETLVYTDDDSTVDIRIDADLDIEDVDLIVESRATQFAISTPASHVGGKMWRADVPIDRVPDDGEYDISVVATDTLETPGFDAADEALVIDRESPSMSLSIEDVTDEAATILIESDEPLAEEPTVTAEIIAEDGTTADATVQIDTTNAESTRFTGTLAAADASAIIDGGVGEYAVTTTGTDRAGNEGTDEASVAVYTQFTLDDGVLELPRSGTTIEFNLADDVDEAIVAQELFARLSENGNSPNLAPEQTGVNFLTADLDSFIDYHLEEETIESATISIAVDESTLGVSTIDDVEIQYYNEGSDQWESVETEYDTTGATSYVTADVTHFSTYGAVTVDTDAPEIVDLSPANGAEIDADNDVSVTAEYADDQSGVDIGSVSISVNGVDVTTDDQTTITSSNLEYALTPAPDTEYTVTISVSDHAGNSATDETTFSTFQDGSGGSSSGSSSETTTDETPSSEEPTSEEPTPEEPTTEEPSDDESPSNEQSADTPNNELTTEQQSNFEPTEESPSTSSSVLVLGVVVGGVALLVIGSLLARRP